MRDAATTSARLARLPDPPHGGRARGWQPRRTVNGDVTVSKPGAVIENMRIINGDLVIDGART